MLAIPTTQTKLKRKQEEKGRVKNTLKRHAQFTTIPIKPSLEQTELKTLEW